MMSKLIPLKELFRPVYGVNLELIRLEKCNKNDDGSIRFVSRTENNNGISAYVKKIIGVVPNPAHTISVAVSGSVLSSFYQDDEYYSGRDLYYLVPKIKMSKEDLKEVSTIFSIYIFPCLTHGYYLIIQKKNQN